MKPALLAIFITAGLSAPAPGGRAADEQAEAILRRAQDAMARLNSLQADVEYVSGARVYTGTAALQRPNLARFELKGYPTELLVSDGKALLAYTPSRNRYTRTAPKPDGSNIVLPLSSPLQGFFTPQDLLLAPAGTKVTAQRMTVEGVSFDVVDVVHPPESFRPPVPPSRRPGDAEALRTQAVPEQTQRVTIRYLVSPVDHLIYRITTLRRVEDHPGVTSTFTLRNVKANAPLSAAMFQWTPPANARVVVLKSPDDGTADILPLGRRVPDFELPQPGGTPLTLSTELAQNKATLVIFWAYSNGSSRQALPQLQKLQDELKGRGFQIIAVDSGDSEPVVAKYFADSKFTMRPVLGGKGEQNTVGKAFGVRAYPTAYLVDAQGRVLWSGVGFQPETADGLRAAALKAVSRAP